MLASLKQSGQWDKTLLVVTSDHGEEFGENGQIAHGGNLGHVLVEVPLVIKLPAGFPRKLAMPTARPRGERAGGADADRRRRGRSRSPARRPASSSRSTKGALSELYLGNGVNRFSLVDGDLQLLWESHFAPPEPDYYRAHLAGIGGNPVPPLDRAVPGRLRPPAARSSRTALPLSGRRGDPPRLTLVRWTAGGAQPVNDPREIDRMARAAQERLAGRQRRRGAPRPLHGSPAASSRRSRREELRALGYVAGGN